MRLIKLTYNQYTAILQLEHCEGEPTDVQVAISKHPIYLLPDIGRYIQFLRF